MKRKYRLNPDVTAARRKRRLEKWLPIAEAMAAEYRAGQTLREIGDRRGITRERVRQVMTEFLGIRSADGGLSVAAKENAERRRLARDKRYLAKVGCTYAEYLSIRGKATRAYSQQRQNAAYRGIEWHFNLWSWWKVWETSGKWSERKRGSGYCMCRRGDVGPYSPENVFIAPARLNSSAQRRKKSGMPMGVRKVGSRFIAQGCVNGKVKHIGTYDTADAAHVAYLRAITGLDAVAA